MLGPDYGYGCQRTDYGSILHALRPLSERIEVVKRDLAYYERKAEEFRQMLADLEKQPGALTGKEGSRWKGLSGL